MCFVQTVNSNKKKVERGTGMLPSDPVMLLSVINTALRDSYPDLDALCDALDADPEEIKKILASIDYRYDAAQNKFI